MSKTKRQKKREFWADLCDSIAGGPSTYGNELRAANRRIEKRKRKQFRSLPE